MPEAAQTVEPHVYAALRQGAIVARPETPGILELVGDDAAEFLQGQVTNDIQALAPGQGAYAALLTPKGRIRTDLRILNTGDRLTIVADASRLPVIRGTIDSFRIGYRFETREPDGDREMLSLVGPRSLDLLAQALGAAATPAPAENSVTVGADGLLSVTTLLGADLIGPPGAVADVERRLADVGAVPGNEDALELARIERGIPRVGMEIDERTIPEEAGLNERAVSFTKGCYVGQETVARLHYKGKPNRRLRGLSLDEAVPAGAVVTAADGRELGHLGGVAVSPTDGPIGLAILRREAETGDAVNVDGVSARVTEPGGDGGR